MNILIENAESLEFFAGEGAWIKNAAESRRFPGTSQATKAGKLEPIGRFNIVGYIPETKQFINLNHGRGKGVPEVVPAQE
jgi:hypothetical protein